MITNKTISLLIDWMVDWFWRLRSAFCIFLIWYTVFCCSGLCNVLIVVCYESNLSICVYVWGLAGAGFLASLFMAGTCSILAPVSVLELSWQSILSSFWHYLSLAHWKRCTEQQQLIWLGTHHSTCAPVCHEHANTHTHKK